MKLPDFLIVGAMKAGTTTLYRDLLTHDRVFFPIDKEPGTLTQPGVLDREGRAAYAALFCHARPDQVCGEASTVYTKRPDHESVAERARELLGPELKVIYLVREPVARIISHHHHEVGAGRMSPEIDEAVRRCPALLNYSRYAMQIQPWLDAFGPKAVRLVRFERLVADRPGVAAELQAFLGLEPRPELVDPEKVFNRSKDKPAAHGWAYRVSKGSLYRHMVRPWLTPPVKDRLRRLLLPRIPPRPTRPTPATVHYIVDALAEDQARLAELMGVKPPVWDSGAIHGLGVSNEGDPPTADTRSESVPTDLGRG